MLRSSCTSFLGHARGRCSPLLLPGSDCYLKLCAPLIQHAIPFVPEVLISFFRARPSGVKEYKVTRSVRVINLPCRRLYIRYFHYFPPEYNCHKKKIFWLRMGYNYYLALSAIVFMIFI